MGIVAFRFFLSKTLASAMSAAADNKASGKSGSKTASIAAKVVLDKSYTPKVIKESVRVHCTMVSTAEDSGHRGFLEAEVDEKVELFLGGQYLQTILRKPTLRTFAGARVTCKDGLLKLLDGRKVVEAVKRCLKIYNDPDPRQAREGDLVSSVD